MTDGTADGGAATGPETEGAAGDADRPAVESDDDAYGGLLGAFPYAFRASDSWLFKLYVAVGGLLAALVALLFALSLVVLIGETVGVGAGSFSFSRAFVVVLMLLVVGPLVAPTLAVARRHRRTGSSVAYDRALAATGYGFLLASYLGLVISTPAQQQAPTTGAFGPLLAWLYGLPRLAGFVPPLLVVGAMVLLHRHFR
jgi:hypothetical protein